MRTLSPIFLIPMSLRWDWSISIKTSPLMLLSASVSDKGLLRIGFICAYL